MSAHEKSPQGQDRNYRVNRQFAMMLGKHFTESAPKIIPTQREVEIAGHLFGYSNPEEAFMEAERQLNPKNEAGRIATFEDVHDSSRQITITYARSERIFLKETPFAFLPENFLVSFPAFAVHEDFAGISNFGSNMAVVSTPYGKYPNVVRAADGQLYEFMNTYIVSPRGNAAVLQEVIPLVEHRNKNSIDFKEEAEEVYLGPQSPNYDNPPDIYFVPEPEDTGVYEMKDDDYKRLNMILNQISNGTLTRTSYVKL